MADPVSIVKIVEALKKVDGQDLERSRQGALILTETSVSVVDRVRAAIDIINLAAKLSPGCIDDIALSFLDVASDTQLFEALVNVITNWLTPSIKSQSQIKEEYEPVFQSKAIPWSTVILVAQLILSLLINRR